MLWKQGPRAEHFRLSRGINQGYVRAGWLSVAQQPLSDGPEIERIDLDADAVAARVHRGEGGSTRTQERIEHRIADEREHPNEPIRDLHWIGRGMLASGCSAYIVPDLAIPAMVKVFGNA